MVETISRNIRYYGILRPPSDIKNIKWWRLTADIIKPPLSTYRNDRYLTPYGFWGYVQTMYADRVLQTYRLSYENEIVAYNINTDLFLHQSISCSLEAIFTSLVNVAVWIKPGYEIQRNNPIKDWVNLAMPITEFRFKLLTEDTIFKFTYEYESQENCDVPESSPPPPPPPPPPPKQNSFPPDTPDDQLPAISPAYDNDTDGGLTYKPQEPTPPPVGEPCQTLTITFKYEIDSNGDGNFIEQQFTDRIFAVFEGLFVKRSSDGSPNVYARAQGLPAYQSCQPTIGEYGLTGFTGLGNQAVIKNVQVVSLE